MENKLIIFVASINVLSKVGIGAYRMSFNSKEHVEALSYGLENGINLIDTASNYMDGESETLIGNWISKNSREKIFIVSKAGYIQGADLSKYSSLFEKVNHIKISQNFYYSIDPKFLHLQIEASLKRLQTDYLDAFLIHNPEHYFDIENLHQPALYEHLTLAFSFLETLVKKGIIRNYGISSNSLPTPSEKNGINLATILDIINANSFNHFKIAQFPYNLIENQASKPFYSGNKSLINLCSEFKLTSLSNRPLNTTLNGRVLRLADYTEDIKRLDENKERQLFSSFLGNINKQLESFGEETPAEAFTPIKFFIENRKNIANPEAVDRAINMHLFPFLTQLQLTNESRFITIVNQLRNYWILYSKRDITIRAHTLREELVSKHILPKDSHMNLSLLACESYLQQGIDHVLVGMKSKKYVDSFKTFFNPK